MPEHLLDRDQVDPALVVVGRAGPPHRVRAEPAGLCRAFELQQVSQPVTDAAPVQPPARLVGEQRQPGGQPRPHVIQIPAQDQVKTVQHRHPAGPRPRSPGRLPEPHMDLAERAAVKMQVGGIERDRLLGPQTSVIQRPVKRIITCGRGEHPRGAHPLPQEGEEPGQPVRRRRRPRLRRVRADVPRGVELINRVGEPDPEIGLDLGGLAGEQEREEPFEHRQVAPPGAGRHARRRELPGDPVDVLPGHLPGRAAAGLKEPLESPRAVADGQRAEATGDLGCLVGLDARRLVGIRAGQHAGQARPGGRDQAKTPTVHGIPSCHLDCEGVA